MFRKVLLEEAAKLKLSRLQMLRLRLHMALPSLAKEIEMACEAEVLARGLVTSTQNIDWDKLREFLMWFIPFLIELIGKTEE